jgi:hypothetical protein
MRAALPEIELIASASPGVAPAVRLWPSAGWRRELPDVELLAPEPAPPRPEGPPRTSRTPTAWRSAPAVRRPPLLKPVPVPAPAPAPPAAPPRPATTWAGALALARLLPGYVELGQAPARAAPVPAGPPPPTLPEPRRPPLPWALALPGAAIAMALLALVRPWEEGGRPQSVSQAGPATALTGAARREIPPDYLRLYQRFGRRMGIDWTFLAAIGAQESDHGRNTWAARVNHAGCVGPMQVGVGGRCGDFVGAWGTDGNGDGRVDPLEPADAIATAARGLREAKGAPPTGGPPSGYRRAACGYYGACSADGVEYAEEVMRRARRYGFPARAAAADRTGGG